MEARNATLPEQLFRSFCAGVFWMPRINVLSVARQEAQMVVVSRYNQSMMVTNCLSRNTGAASLPAEDAIPTRPLLSVEISTSVGPLFPVIGN